MLLFRYVLRQLAILIVSFYVEVLFRLGAAKSSHSFNLARVLRTWGRGVVLFVRRSSLFCKVGRMLKIFWYWQKQGKKVERIDQGAL
jgi:hypothetical protein